MSNMELVPGILSFFSGLGVRQNIPPTTKGWGRVDWGMSFDTVKTNYPQAIETSGRKLEYTPEANPQGRDFKFTFGFDSGHQLESFSLSFSGSSETADYATLVQELTRQLGAPVATTTTSTTWNRDETEITLSAQPEGGIVLSEIA
jgi:hypothetical protein